MIYRTDLQQYFSAYEAAWCEVEFTEELQSLPAPAQTVKVFKCLLFELLLF